MILYSPKIILSLPLFYYQVINYINYFVTYNILLF